MRIHKSRRKIGRALAATFVAGGALALAAPADGVDYTINCTALLVVGENPPAEIPVEQQLSLVLNAPVSVAPNTEFDAVIPAGTTDLPAEAEGQTIVQYSDLLTSYRITGGTIVAGSVTGGATHAGDTITLSTPGPVAPGPLATPEVAFKILAGAAGTTIVATGAEIKLTAHLGGALAGATAATTCAVPSTPPLSTTSVVAPGAPTANDDTATTPQDNPTTIDVLANDVPNAEFALDPTTLSITVPPQSGALADIVNGAVRYTPPIGFNGTDTFSYQVCSVPDAEGAPGACDSAVVTVTVEPPQQVQQEATTTTTVAAAATQLPRTGPASRTFTMLGFVFTLVGAAALVMVPRQRKPRWLAD